MAPDEKMTEQHRVWEDWAQADPLWAILSDPSRKGGKWDLPEFFASGEREIDLVLGQIEERGLGLNRERCLDFGCGVGRLTQALAKEFDRSDGVDISETMVVLARGHNQTGERCHYHVNLEPDLALFDDDSFDFVFSTIVLQHNPPEVAEHYIIEFVRILAPGGIAVFDMTADLTGVPFPERSHRGEIEVVAPASMVPGQSGRVRVSVTNVSGTDWPPGTRLGIGNHWRSADGSEMVVQDDARHPLPGGLAVGATLEVDLFVTPPGRPGTYQLEIDLVEEGTCWFADMGSSPATSLVSVAAPKRGRFRRSTTSAPVDLVSEALPNDPTPFAMNGLPREQVTAAVVRSGGEVVDVLTSVSGGENWDGYRYFVRRPAGLRG